VAAPGAEGEQARQEIERAIRLQEAAGLDILAHGAYDRADMVEVGDVGVGVWVLCCFCVCVCVLGGGGLLLLLGGGGGALCV
jgi:hypothetical protein